MYLKNSYAKHIKRRRKREPAKFLYGLFHCNFVGILATDELK
jgi:hypothetical protein